jgi:microcystin-dependent protein
MPFEPVLGQIMPFAGSVVPRGWAPCNGQLLAINQNTALFSLLGTYYGGDGIRTFGLPDLRGRAILGASPTITPGETGGSETVTLNVQQLASHTHNIQASTTNGSGRGSSAAGHVFGVNTEPSTKPTAIFAAPGTNDVALQVGTNVMNDGGGAAHNNMQPYLAISYLIALNGIFPSRS